MPTLVTYGSLLMLQWVLRLTGHSSQPFREHQFSVVGGAVGAVVAGAVAVAEITDTRGRKKDFMALKMFYG